MDMGLVTPRCRERHVERVSDVLGPHRGAQLPGDDVARVIIEDRRQVHPAPADDLEVGKIGLPHLVWSCRLVGKLGCRLDDDEGRAGDQIMRLQQAVNRGFRYEVAPLVGEAHRQFPGAYTRTR